MQFHLDGFRPGDPTHHPAASAQDGAAGNDGDVDVLIVGSGPAGLTLAAQLAVFPSIRTRIVERRPGPLDLGQADGIACRTMEMFNAFGFADRVMKEAYWVNEVTFWKPQDGDGPIMRHGRIRDTEEGLSEFPHVILNQARVHDFYLEAMRHAPTRLQPDYDLQLAGLTIPDNPAQPVEARLRPAGAEDASRDQIVRARYVVGCDGARSQVRRQIGRELRGEAANQAWGVMDVLAYTDFPDIRLKSAIHSAQEGNILIIPREGGYLVRLYIELDKLAADERVASRNITQETLIAAAQRILHPYVLEVKEVAWWSVYEIGQRLTDRFDDLPADAPASLMPRVFIAGDACHTHSPKAGQGMNVSMQDSFNLGWKLAAVLRGQADAGLLRSYSAERQGVAQELIDFDREFARMFSARPKNAEDDDEGVDPAEFQRYFIQHGRFTAGTATRYRRSELTGPDTHQHLAAGFPVGMRFHSAPVIRLADARPMHLGHVAQADGRWRIYLFADAQGLAPGSGLARLCGRLDRDGSVLRRHTPAGADPDAVFDIRAILQQPHQSLSMDDLPGLLWPRKGRHGLRDYEKAFCADPAAGDIFDRRGIDRERGCMVVVRPDQYVAQVLPLEDDAALGEYFAGVLRPVG